MNGTLGKIVVVAAGTPVRCSATSLNVNTAIFSTISGQSGQQMYIGVSTLVKATLVGVLKILQKPLATPTTLDSWTAQHSTSQAAIDLSAIWLDADTSGDGLLVSYVI